DRWHPVPVAVAPFLTSDWDSKPLAPYRQFFKKKSEEKEANYFRSLIKRTWHEDIKRKIKPDSLIILIPAFKVSKLT
ncbi:EscR/YscR/HrcR family type III secretion system export apparatus protein, partial [Salmonella enterica subsp. enterica serovar Weltevreden]|nr:EscR/YscR/HrcR family type III secretion system export apparatus protein [Salmonella enterica subsp. enterica serovar Weltevreden]